MRQQGLEQLHIFLAERVRPLPTIEAERDRLREAGHASDQMSSAVEASEVVVILTAQKAPLRNELGAELGAPEMMAPGVGEVAAGLRDVGVDPEEVGRVDAFAVVPR